MPKRTARPGPRGLSAEEMVSAAVALMEEQGESGFSIRKLGAKLGCDPMAVLYHFGSKAGLERAMADAINAELRPVDPQAPWRTRLMDLMHQYRELALRYPKTFPLLLRFWVTGPADYRHAEAMYQALADAGLDDRDVVDICFGLYASALGLAVAEVGGLLQPARPEDIAEVEALSPEEFPATRRLAPAFEDLEPVEVYRKMADLLLDGVELQMKAAKA